MARISTPPNLLGTAAIIRAYAALNESCVYSRAVLIQTKNFRQIVVCFVRI